MTETYSISADFPNGIATGQLVDEIEADSSITTTLERIDTLGDAVYIIFVSTISPSEKTALNAVVAAHIPFPTSNIVIVDGYIEMISNLADTQSVNISANNPAGGMVINAGTGGIDINSDNSITLDAAAACNFTTTNGNLLLSTTAGLTNIESSGSGINIGSASDTTPINIGTSSTNRTITLGNLTGNTALNLWSGTGGITMDTASGGGISLDATGADCNFTLAATGNDQDLTIALTGAFDSSIVLSSAGTSSDAILLNAVGGITNSANGVITLATSDTSGGAITLNSYNEGGINIAAGSAGIGINSGSGLIGIGHWSAGNMQIGTSAVARTIDIGNQTGATAVNIDCGTGGFNVDSTRGISMNASANSCNWTLATTGNSQDLTIALTGTTDSSIVITSAGTASDAINIYSAGGINTNAAGIINLASASNSGGAISLDASSNNGGVGIASGSQGIAINSGTGLIGIGHWSAGDIQIGTSAVARTITCGNSTGGTTINIDCGTGGLNLGTAAVAKTITIGSSTGGSTMVLRYGTGGLIRSQEAPVSLSDSSQTVTIANLLTGILYMNPTANRTITLPTAANVVAGISGVQIGDSFDFSIINQAIMIDIISIAMGSGGIMVGNTDIYPIQNMLATYFTSAAGAFRLRITNITSSSEAYTIYRIS